jgi:HK97 family phage portal protein
MGVFSRLWGRKSASRLALEDLLADGFFTQPAKSGVAVTWKTALQATTALACARVIAEGLAQVPLRVFRSHDGVRTPAEDHPLYGLLGAAPNDWQTSFEFIEQVVMHLVFCGNAFVFVNRGLGRIIELLPYEPQQVTVKRDGYVSSYEVTTDDGRHIGLSASEMWHLRGPSWNGWLGLEGVRLAREAIGLSLATEEHGARLFSNGAVVGGILSTEQVLNEEQRLALRKSWEARHAGGGNAFKTAVLWGGMKFTSMTAPNDQAQFLETRKFQVEEICRAFRVLPIMVGYSDKTATYASAEQMFLAHVVHTLSPWCRRIETSIAKNLFSEEERRQGLYAKFMLNGLLRGAAKDRAEFYARMYGIGALNPNEVREYEDMNPYEGGERYRVPLNMTDPAEPADGDNAEDTVDAAPQL